MDIRGIWKVKEMRLPSPDGELVFTPGTYVCARGNES